MKEQPFRSNHITYDELEYFILTHLYYSMGVNRMVLYDYRTLLVPQLKIDIKNSIKGMFLVGTEEGIYSVYDIYEIIKDIKTAYKLFGTYKKQEVGIKAIIYEMVNPKQAYRGK